MVSRDILKIGVGQKFAKQELVDWLERSEYKEDKLIGRPGEFASRGTVLDIFPVSFRKPIRIVFDLDTIESIRDFSVHSGQSLQNYTELRLVPATSSFMKRMSKAAGYFEERDPSEGLKNVLVGDYIVHVNYGIGLFAGTKVLRIQGKPIKHLAIEFSDREILYIEEVEAPLIDRYWGFEGRPPKLTKLHTKDWANQKEKTRVAVRSYARELLILQAKRSAFKGFRANPDNEWQIQFEKEFPYEETPDQLQSTRDVKSDMEGTEPMDRLLCGDVGYGKTEVAFRGAFKAVMGGKQVAFLVPTTILAEQHYLTLKQRVKNFPVRVECLSRFKTKREQSEIVAQLKDGSCDVVIGTHRLLSRDVHFKDLGLVIIDEEQRFGVKHKEKLKRMREMVDVLTLTATPIPRTLYMALVGARNMSVISTPPRNRMPVETDVIDYEDTKITEIIRREVKREGQVYFVHNRVQSIDRIATNLKKLMPEIRFGVAHGQMPPRALESTMFQFIQREIDCLISTSIIESGLDIPNVNTLIVNRADNFGLADLYQLRGRVGRFDRRAYAYFIIPKHKTLSEDADKRLAAIQRFTELGAGFQVAMEDLEIRGAGNLLGTEQSGFIYQVGFDLYCRLLREAVDELSKSVNTKGRKE